MLFVHVFFLYPKIAFNNPPKYMRYQWKVQDVLYLVHHDLVG